MLVGMIMGASAARSSQESVCFMFCVRILRGKM